MAAEIIQDLGLDGRLIAQKKCDKKSQIEISTNISAIAVKDDLLAVAADEGADILIFKRDKKFRYKEVAHQCIKLDGNKKCGKKGKREEIDIEGLAWGNKHLYVIGSHSLARKTVKKEKSAKKNRQRLLTLKAESSREQLFRVPIDKHGKLEEGKKIKQVSLRDLFTTHPLLSRFRSIPSKENGIDIEGLAVKQVECDGEQRDRLYIGFRGPVLRGNLALIMKLDFKKGKFNQTKIPKNPKIHFLNFEGRGIRGMTELGDDGFLLLTGPVGDAVDTPRDFRYRIYRWDGNNDDLGGVRPKPVCYIPIPNKVNSAAIEPKAEDLELLNKGKKPSTPYELAVVFDGAERGGGKIFSCPVPE